MKDLHIPIVVSATLLLVAAFFGGSPGYYQLLRLIVFLSCLFAAWMLRGKLSGGWFWGMLFAAILYNPLRPVEFAPRTWTVLNTVIGIFLLVSLKAAK